MKIIAPFEFERYCWTSNKKTNLSCASGLLLLLISQNEEATPIRAMVQDLLDKHGEEVGRYDWIVQPMSAFVDYEYQRHKLPIGYRKVSVIKLNDDICCIPVDSVDGQLLKRMYTEVKLYRKHHPKAGFLVFLVLYALYFRKLRKMSDINNYLQSSATNLSSASRVATRLAEIGVIQLIRKPGTGDKGKMLLLPID
ncbi:MAG: hypothetical protein GJ680_18445 [Alteromonadaceae bacterium]|nr:hypothetical protein [Alteromonadaceae bacterium]